MAKKFTRTATADRVDLYEAVTAEIIAALEAGTRPWSRPWGSVPGAELQQRATGQHYRGINQLLLSLVAGARGYSSPYWMTFKQAADLGGNVRKGEKSTQIVFYKTLSVEDRDAPADAAERTKQIPLLRGYRVFNADQCDGLPARFHPAPLVLVDSKRRDDAAETALRSSSAKILEGGNRAFYAPGTDHVQMPPFAAFETVGGYLATLSHELVHWTGAKHRLDREFGSRFGDKRHAFEELVAELGSCFVGARLGIAGEHIENHAAYIGSWLKGLREDKRAIFRAAALAQGAADLVLVNAGLDVDQDDDAGELDQAAA